MGYEKLNEKMMELKDEIFASLKESIAIESVKGAPEEDAPYGRGPKEALDHALALGEKLGFKTGNLDNKVGWIEYGDGEEMAAVLGHLDIHLEKAGNTRRLDARSTTDRCTDGVSWMTRAR